MRGKSSQGFIFLVSLPQRLLWAIYVAGLGFCQVAFLSLLKTVLYFTLAGLGVVVVPCYYYT